jgi:hypothetical protein
VPRRYGGYEMTIREKLEVSAAVARGEGMKPSSDEHERRVFEEIKLPSIAYAIPGSLAEGAQLASRQLW